MVGLYNSPRFLPFLSAAIILFLGKMSLLIGLLYKTFKFLCMILDLLGTRGSYVVIQATLWDLSLLLILKTSLRGMLAPRLRSVSALC